MTIEQKAQDYADQANGPEPHPINSNLWMSEDSDRYEIWEKNCLIAKSAYLAGYNEAAKWIEVTPETMPQPNKRVFAIVKGWQEVQIFERCWIDGDVIENSGFVWCNCYCHLYDDPQFDDDYEVTHWMPLPTPPKQ